jgi:hypothetical protein
VKSEQEILEEIASSGFKSKLEDFFNSPGYAELNRQLSVNNARFENLTPGVQLLATYLNQSGADLDLNNDIAGLFYKRRPPTIEEYLTPAYLPETTQILYPLWDQTMRRVYDPTKEYFEWIIGGGIGIGKTTTALVAHNYNLIRLSCLRNPKATLGAAPNKNLVLSLFTVTLPKARKALVEPFKALMSECSEIFVEVDRKEYESGFAGFARSDKVPFYDAKNELLLPNSISVMLGSNTSHALSFDMFGAFLDEAEFRAGDVEKAFEVYSSLRERVRSRFLGSRFTLVTLVSSARYSTGVLAQYTANIPADDPHAIYSAAPIWEVKNFNSYKDGVFYVLRGNSNHPSKILAAEHEAIEAGTYVAPEGTVVLKVPKTYYKDFDLRIEEAIRNLAGMQTLGADHPFGDTSRLEDANLLPLFQLVAPLGEGVPLINKLPADLFVMTAAGRRFRRYPTAARYVHLDLAEANIAGVTVLHKELRGDQTVYVVDFLCEITSPTRIDINAVKRLMIDLKRGADVQFSVISADQYQSTAIRQELEVEKIATSVVLRSVDRTLWPISEAARLVAQAQVKIGPCQRLRDQMAQVSISSKAPLIKRGPAGKDVLDSLIGALINAVEDFENRATHPYIAVAAVDHVQQIRSGAFEGMESI